MPSESAVTTWRCRKCGRLKGDTNRWWALRLGPDKERGWQKLFALRPFTEPLFDDEVAVCSRSCAVAALTEYMQGAEHV